MLLRFGRVLNDAIRGFHIRGWNYLTKDTKNAYQKYCNKERNFADCFEKFQIGTTQAQPKETGIDNFYEIHGNYWKGKNCAGEPCQQNCGTSEDPSFNEDALGVVCQ